MVYLKYVENVIPLSKLIGLLFLFCLPLLSILFLKTKRNDLARPVMGTIFLVRDMEPKAIYAYSAGHSLNLVVISSCVYNWLLQAKHSGENIHLPSHILMKYAPQGGG